MKRIPLLIVPVIALASCSLTVAPKTDSPPASEYQASPEFQASPEYRTLEIAWGRQSPTSQANICANYRTMPEYVVSQLTGYGVSTTVIKAFLTTTCRRY